MVIACAHANIRTLLKHLEPWWQYVRFGWL